MLDNRGCERQKADINVVKEHNRLMREEAEYQAAGGFVPGCQWIIECRDAVAGAKNDRDRAYWQDQLDDSLREFGEVG